MENPLEFGIVITQPDGTIERFLEKPTWGEVFSDTINTGIYVLEPVVFDYIPEGEVVDFSGDVFPALLEDGHTLHGHVSEGYWEDVGTLEAYLRAHTDVLDGRVHVEIDGFQLGEGRWIGTDVEISPEARIDDPVVIGDSCRIEPGVHLRPYTVLGTDVIVKADAFIERSVLHDHVYVGQGANLRGCVIGRNTDLRSHVRVDEGTVVGDECFVGQDAVINPERQGVPVQDGRVGRGGHVVDRVGEPRRAHALRAARRARPRQRRHQPRGRRAPGHGLQHVDPEGRDDHREPRHQPHRARAQARAHRRHQPLGRQRGGHRARHRAAHALPGAQQPLAGRHHRAARARRSRHRRDPLLRHRRPRHRPGAQRKIERLLYREDFRRAFGGDVGDIVFPPRSLEFYTAALERIVDIEQVRRQAFKIVLDYSFGAASIVMPSLLTKLGAEVLAVNPFASTASATATAEVRDAQVARLADLVRVSGSDLGFVIDPEGELAVVVDDTGHILEPEELLLASIALDQGSGAGGQRRGAGQRHQRGRGDPRVDGRGGAHAASGARASWRPRRPRNVVFAGTPDGGCVWPDFLPAYDAAVTLVKLLDLLAAVDRPLSQVVAALPSTHVAHETIVTPWERKGTVMREIVERAGTRETELIDGVKVIEADRWALVLPDPDEALTHVWAEAGSDVEARRTAQEYVERIRQVLR